MNHKDSIVLSYLSNTASKLSDEFAARHEDGEFLPEITQRNPHLHKMKDKLFFSYCMLMTEINSVYRIYGLNRKEGKSKFKEWLKRLDGHRRLEHKLHFDSCFVDIGGDH